MSEGQSGAEKAGPTPTPTPTAGPTPAPEALLEAVGVDVRLGGQLVLDNVDLTVAPGEIVTLIGPNGSGKSTLIRAVLGLTALDAGRVRLGPGIRVGYVPQHFRVEATLPLSVRRFLLLALDRRAADSGARIALVLEEVGCGALLETPFQGLSGGESRRVLLAQALLREPDLLVLDEPSTGVDAAGQAELYSLIRAVRDRRGCGVLLVSHDLHLVMAATDRVVCLNRHVCCSGRPETVTRDPEYLALFGPDLAGALAVYTHDHDHSHALSGEERDNA